MPDAFPFPLSEVKPFGWVPNRKASFEERRQERRQAFQVIRSVIFISLLTKLSLAGLAKEISWVARALLQPRDLIT
jgi:hypothetical protein